MYDLDGQGAQANKSRCRARHPAGVLRCAFALDPSLDINQYAHTAWKVRDGFTKGHINRLRRRLTATSGSAREFGLLRFDGVRAVPWQPPGDQHLPPGTIFSLLVAEMAHFGSAPRRPCKLERRQAYTLS
jgi:hypothetical protein